jgi:hypothetical protein
MTLNLCGNEVNLLMNAARQTVAEISGFPSAMKQPS